MIALEWCFPRCTLAVEISSYRLNSGCWNFCAFPSSGEDGFETGRGVRDSAEISRPLFSTDRRRIGTRESHRRSIRGSVGTAILQIEDDARLRAQNQERQEASTNRQQNGAEDQTGPEEQQSPRRLSQFQLGG